MNDGHLFVIGELERPPDDAIAVGIARRGNGFRANRIRALTGRGHANKADESKVTLRRGCVLSE